MKRTQLVCDGLAGTLRRHGVPEQILTDNGVVFTGKYAQPPVEVHFSTGSAARTVWSTC